LPKLIKTSKSVKIPQNLCPIWSKGINNWSKFQLKIDQDMAKDKKIVKSRCICCLFFCLLVEV